jgi:hypothetical protein
MVNLASNRHFCFCSIILAALHFLTSLLIGSCRVPIRALSYKPSEARSVSLFTVPIDHYVERQSDGIAVTEKSIISGFTAQPECNANQMRGTCWFAARSYFEA